MYDEFEYICEYVIRNKDFYKELFGSFEKILITGDDLYDQSIHIYKPKIPTSSPFYEYTRWNDSLAEIEFNGSSLWLSSKTRNFKIHSQINRGSWEIEIEPSIIKSPFITINSLAEEMYNNFYSRPLSFELDSDLKSMKYKDKDWKYFQ